MEVSGSTFKENYVYENFYMKISSVLIKSLEVFTQKLDQWFSK